jgi:hypothetical protein
MAVELPTNRNTCWWEDAIITTRLRFAAGVCVLSTGLLIGSGGGAIAWADTDSASESSASPTSSQATEGSAQGVSTVSEPAKPVANPLKTTLQNVTTVLRSLRKLANQQPQTVERKSGLTESGVPSAEAEENTEALGAATTDVSPPAAETTAVATDETVLASDTNVTPPVTNPLTNPLAVVVPPVTKAVATVGAAALKVPGVVMALPTSPTPVTDVITTVQELLTAVNNAVVPLAQIPSDLYSMFAASMLTVPMVTATKTVGGGVNPVASAPLWGARATQEPQAAPIVLAGGMALPSDIVPPTTFGDIELAGLSNELPAPGTAPPAQDVVAQSGIGSFLEHTVGALFVPASLSALAAVAVPGIGGLLLICALGMRIGYRQAKALFEVRRAGIAAFAGPGPLGVVRSGSLISLRPRALGVRPDRRALRVVRSETSNVVSLRSHAA